MGFRSGLFERDFGARNFEQPRQLLKRRSQCGPQSVDRAFRPNVSEDEAGDDKAEEDSNDTIADVVEISIRRIALEDAVEKSKCYL